MKYLISIFFFVHGLIHLGFVSPKPNDPKYPFVINKSWLGLPESALKPIGITLTIIAVIGFILLALAWVGWLVPAEWIKVLAIISSVASLLLMSLFWSNMFIVGFLLDLAIIYLLVLKK